MDAHVTFPQRAKKRYLGKTRVCLRLCKIIQEVSTQPSTHNTHQQLRQKLALLRDDALLRISESTQSEYTPEARTIIDAEVSLRGGLEALKERVSLAEKTGQSKEELARLRRFFIVAIIAACALFIFALNGSSWFYWICLFALIAALFGVLLSPRPNPEDEIEELLEKAKSEGGTSSAGEFSSPTS